MTWSNVVGCPQCGTEIQRTVNGNLQDGLIAHYAAVHPGKVVPLVKPRPTP